MPACSAPDAIGATVERGLQGASNPLPSPPSAVALGMAGHMMNSLVAAAPFAAWASSRDRSDAELLGTGLGWLLIVYEMMWKGVVPQVDPLMRNLDGRAFLVGHVVFGATLALAWSQLERGEDRSPAPHDRRAA